MSCLNGQIADNVCKCNSGWTRPSDFIFKESQDKLKQGCSVSLTILYAGYGLCLFLSTVTLFMATKRMKRFSQLKRLIPVSLGLCCLGITSVVKIVDPEAAIGLDLLPSITFASSMCAAALMHLVLMRKYIKLHKKLLFTEPDADEKLKYGTTLTSLSFLSASLSPISFSSFLTGSILAGSGRKLSTAKIFSDCGFYITVLQALVVVGFTYKLFNSFIDQLDNGISIKKGERLRTKIVKNFRFQRSILVVMLLLGAVTLALTPALFNFPASATYLSLLFTFFLVSTIFAIVLTNTLSIRAKEKALRTSRTNYKRTNRKNNNLSQDVIENPQKILDSDL